MVDYYDGLLAAIPAAIAVGALASVHPAVAMYQGLALGSVLSSAVLAELLFRNPPTEPTRARTAGAATVGVGWLLSVAFYRRSRPSASGLDPEGEGRTLR